jgi:hypothetical protein
MPTSLAPQADQSAQRVPVQRHPEEFMQFVPAVRQPEDITLVSVPVTEGPSIDGYANEAFWATAPAITTLDYSSQRPITIASVYTTDTAFFLVTFPDEDASETHKDWIWDTHEEIYREGPEREDVFIFKWSMTGNNVSLALRDAELHSADIWFWKARRTNPAGYADDKGQSMALEPGADTRQIPSAKHGSVHFRRWGDVGEPAFEEKFFFEYQGQRLTKYLPQQPTGSRGDVRAKGVWHNGLWTIELARALNTGHDDDLVFAPGGVYLFGVSCYAMAYDNPHDAWSQPLYRTGDVFDRLFFTMAPRDGE